MRLLSRFVIALVTCLIAIALPSIPAYAQCGGPLIHLTPGSGVPGTQLIVSGENYGGGMFVDIYYDGTLMSEGTKTSAGGTFAIPFTIPESDRGDHEIIVDVATSVGHIELESAFYATPGLTVSPVHGPVGTTVTVTGHGFFKDETGIELMYYTDQATYQKVASGIEANDDGYWQTTFQIPASPRGAHRMDAEGSASQPYNVEDASFQVTAQISLDKTSGGVGQSITMTGSRFGPYEQDIQILFDGQPVVTGIKADGQGGWDKTFDVPNMASGNYTVTAEGEYTAQQDVIGLNFEIQPNLVLSPTTGHVGTDVTVTGFGLASDKDVTIMYDGSQQATARTDGEGNFEASFSVPASQHGEHQVTIGYSPGAVASAIFTLESDPPSTPQLISPSDGSRVGVRGTVTPTFEWSAVTDDSGVSYNFQIATSPDVTGTGDFVNPMISVKDLTATSYTVTEALPKGTYYWIVQAVDGAQNEGSWTAASVLSIGLLPLWAFIAIIVAIVVIVIAVARALVRRRRFIDDW
jgi:hypothetical protein